MRSPRYLILTVVIGVLFCTSTVIAKPTYWPFRSPLEYREKLAALKYYVRLHAKQKINTFYLAKLVADPNSQKKDQHLYAYWPEGKMIISVAYLEPEETASSMGSGNQGFVYLDSQIREKASDIKGAIYLVTRDWATYIINGCRKGRKVVIRKT